MQLITGSVATISGAVEVINVTDLNISVTFHISLRFHELWKSFISFYCEL